VVLATRVIGPFHDFFLAGAGVAGALTGLLFVAISVSPHRVTGEGADPAHRVRAAAALTAFTNAMTISLLALIPSTHLGKATTIVAGAGVLFVVASLLSLRQIRQAQRVRLREASFLAGMLVLFAAQLVAGVQLSLHGRTSTVNTIAILTVVCFLVGIARAWELIGAAPIRLHTEVLATLHGQGDAETKPPPRPPGVTS
jgi:hypothetical protein